MCALEVRHEPQGLILVIDDPAALNDFRSNSFRDALFAVIQPIESPRVAVDLNAIDYLSSTGVAILIGLKRRVDLQGGRLVLFHLQPNVDELLQTMRLSRYFSIAPNEPDALASLSSLPTA